MYIYMCVCGCVRKHSTILNIYIYIYIYILSSSIVKIGCAVWEDADQPFYTGACLVETSRKFPGTHHILFVKILSFETFMCISSANLFGTTNTHTYIYITYIYIHKYIYIYIYTHILTKIRCRQSCVLNPHVCF